MPVSHSPAVERVNVNLPRPLLDDLRRLVPRSRRSEVIARATARELRRLKIASVFEGLAREPLWRTGDYPTLTTPAAIQATVRRLRQRGQLQLPASSRRKARRE